MAKIIPIWQRVAVLLAVVTGLPAGAQPFPAGPATGETVAMSEIIDGETLRLKDGRVVRLAAIVAPRPPLPRSGTQARPDPALDALVLSARSALADQASGRPLTIHPTTRHADRHGRIVAHVIDHKGNWLQAGLVRRGLARVDTTGPSDIDLTVLLQTEAEARRYRRGLWAHFAFRPRKADEAGRWIDTFQLVEGTVATGVNNRAASLTLIGERTPPFTIVIPGKVRVAFRQHDLSPVALAGKTIRVRGWIRWRNGPYIEALNPAQIEMTEPIVARSD